MNLLKKIDPFWVTGILFGVSIFAAVWGGLGLGTAILLLVGISVVFGLAAWMAWFDRQRVDQIDFFSDEDKDIPNE